MSMVVAWIAICSAAAVVFVSGVYIVIPAVVKIILKHRFLDKVTRNKCVFLTFDDGPAPGATPGILDMLKSWGAHATFFMTGRNIDAYPEVVEAVSSAGHDVGIHGYDHLHPWKTGPVASYRDCLLAWKCIRKLRSGGGRPVFYRPPYGKFNCITLAFFLMKGTEMVFWDLDPRDYARQDAEDVVKKIKGEMKHGSVILLHDGRGSSGRSSVTVTIAALDGIMRHLEQCGIQACAISKGLYQS